MPAVKRVLATDIDGTLVGHGGERQFAEFVAAHPGLTVVYLTGRTRHNAEAVLRRYALPTPAALVTEVGAEIYWGEKLRLDDIWTFQQRRDWSPRRVRTALESMPGVRYRGRSSHWRIAFEVDDEAGVRRVRHRLSSLKVPGRVLWDPADQRLDVLPCRAEKGRALAHVLARMGVRPRACFVAGDGENDRDMLAGGFAGVVVANACPALHQLAGGDIWESPHPGAFGVMDGIRRWYCEAGGSGAEGGMASEG